MRSKQLQRFNCGNDPELLVSARSHKAAKRTESVQIAGQITEKEQQKKKSLMETNTSNQRDTETDEVHSALYLTVDVGARIQQHLDHGLVPTHAGIHERGHPLWREQAEEELQAAVSLVSLVYKRGSRVLKRTLIT